MKKIAKKTVALFTSIYLLSFSFALAASDDIKLLDSEATSPKDLVLAVTNYVLLFAGAVAVLFIIYGGFQYITSSGNDKRVEAAKKTLTFAVIGLIVIILAKVIVSFTFTTVKGVLSTPVN